MAERASGEKHKKKFRRWQKRVGENTRYLSQLVEEHIVPVILEAGFRRVDVALNQAEWTVNANEILLERTRDSAIDSVDVTFGKYGGPYFQVGFSRREMAAPNKFIRSGVLVKRAEQRYCFWGKPKWLPSILWSHERSRRSVMAVVACLAQVIRFLDDAERGPNISLE